MGGGEGKTRFDYEEAGPAPLLRAFLQRVVTSVGRIGRDYSLDRSRSDVLVIWPFIIPFPFVAG